VSSVRLATGLFLLLCCVASCAKKADEVRKKSRESLSSWAATTQLMAAQWSRDEVPDVYVRKSAKIAREAVAAQQKSLPPDSEELRHQIAALDALLEKLERAIETRDRAAAARLSDRLQRMAKALRPAEQS
jgi:hypothetical protein